MLKRSAKYRPVIVAVIVLLAVTAIIWWRELAGGGRSAPKPPELPSQPALPKLTAPRIVIDKSNHRLFVYDGEKLAKTYRAAFGPGKGDKVREGDKRTPEGEFYVCTKNPRSRFTLSLGLSYPNAADAARGLRDGLIDQAEHDRIVAAVRSGDTPPWKTALGGEIMIHGHGSARDWTLGCIALEDDDIIELYHAVAIGTPVTIRH